MWVVCEAPCIVIPPDVHRLKLTHFPKINRLATTEHVVCGTPPCINTKQYNY